MLRLNTMLAQRHFRKHGVNEDKWEHWSRGNIHVYRHYALDVNYHPPRRTRHITITYKNNDGTIKSTQTLRVTDPKVRDMIVAFGIPNIEKVSGPSQTSTSASHLLKQAMSAFDKWYSMVGADPVSDIASYNIKIKIDDVEYAIPLATVTASRETGNYLQRLYDHYRQQGI